MKLSLTKKETLLEQKGKRTRKKEEEDKQKTGGVEKKVPRKNIIKKVDKNHAIQLECKEEERK